MLGSGNFIMRNRSRFRTINRRAFSINIFAAERKNKNVLFSYEIQWKPLNGQYSPRRDNEIGKIALIHKISRTPSA